MNTYAQVHTHRINRLIHLIAVPSVHCRTSWAGECDRPAKALASLDVG
ncbi:MAG: hypothetical protein K6T90_10040 [Leptolyngbyaceae cyanobacterium HOT.MB2.61]|nr:hypothetical protein [Leptolyngbyaceae cyanobacterium HOT.MB2.61]